MRSSDSEQVRPTSYNSFRRFGAISGVRSVRSEKVADDRLPVQFALSQTHFDGGRIQRSLLQRTIQHFGIRHL